MRAGEPLPVHLAVGVPIYVKSHFVVRPQFDSHEAPNFNQFGSDW